MKLTTTPDAMGRWTALLVRGPRSLIFRPAWDWGMIGLGVSISFDADIDDWGWLAEIHLLFLYITLNYSHTYMLGGG